MKGPEFQTWYKSLSDTQKEVVDDCTLDLVYSTENPEEEHCVFDILREEIRNYFKETIGV